MRRQRSGKLAAVRDAGRLVQFRDVVFHVGRMLYRRSLRYTVFTAGVSALGLAANLVGLRGFTVRQAVLLPLVVGVGAAVGGILLKSIASLFSARLMTVAQANDLNLMEDYRKTQAAEHLEALWERVFRHEWPLRERRGLPPDVGGEAPSPREEFLALAAYGLGHPLAQSSQRHFLQLDLRAFEDWRDGAYFDRTDAKLTEQYEGNTTLEAVRKAVRFTPAEAVGKCLRRFGQGFWRTMITRALAVHVGGAVRDLNRRYDSDLFNAQVLLWPTEAEAGWLKEYPGARAEVLARRRAVLRRVFGPDLASARAMLDRVLLCDLELAADLRVRYDPDYCDGSLGYDVVSDCLQTGCDQADIARYRRLAHRSAEAQTALTAHVRARRPELLDGENAEAWRAVRIAFHVEAGRRNRPRAGPPDPAALDDLLDHAIEHRRAYSARLVYLRVHHELTRLSIAGYEGLLRELAYSE